MASRTAESTPAGPSPSWRCVCEAQSMLWLNKCSSVIHKSRHGERRVQGAARPRGGLPHPRDQQRRHARGRRMTGPVRYHLGRFPPDSRGVDWTRLVPLIGPASAGLAPYDGLVFICCARPTRCCSEGCADGTKLRARSATNRTGSAQPAVRSTRRASSPFRKSISQLGWNAGQRSSPTGISPMLWCSSHWRTSSSKPFVRLLTIVEGRSAPG